MQYRSLTDSPVEVRSDGDSKIISGYAAVFNSPSHILRDYREIVNPAAFDRTLREVAEGKRVVSARVQHEGGLSTVGSTGNASLRLSKDHKGLKYEIVALPNTTAGRDILELVSGGYITKSSFAFIVPNMQRDVKWDFTTNPPTRELMNVDLVDVAPVDGPAYEQTSVQARALVLEEMRTMQNDVEVPVVEKRSRIEFRASASGGQIAEIYLFDEIVPTWVAKYFGSPLMGSGQVIEALAAVPDAERIDVYINSPGGDVYEGTAIYNTIKGHPAPVNVYVQGVAASMASIIAMAGDTITMGEGSYMMIHNAWTVAPGNATDLRNAALHLDKIDSSLAEILAKRSGNDLASVHKQMGEETWFTAAEAVAAGFADGVAGDGVEIDAVAKRCQEIGYRNIPTEIGGPGEIEFRAGVTAEDYLSVLEAERKKAI